MGKLGSLARWSVKLGATGGAVYMAHTQGFLGSQREADEAWVRAKTTAANNEYLRELPDLPSAEDMGISESLPTVYTGKEYQQGFKRHWNNGVMYTFDQLVLAPAVVKDYVRSGMTQAKDLLAARDDAAEEKQADNTDESAKAKD